MYYVYYKEDYSRGIMHGECAYYGARKFADLIGAEMIDSKDGLSENDKLIEINSGEAFEFDMDSRFVNQMAKRTLQQRVRNAIKNTNDLVINGGSYLNSIIKQRIEGPTNAGSSYQMKPTELLEALYNAEWQLEKLKEVGDGCIALKAPIPGLNGLLDLEDLPEDTILYTIDPKGTGNLGIGAANVPKKQEQETYLILGEEEGKEVVFTFHPRKPVMPSRLENKSYSHGSRISREEAIALGMTKVKYLSPEMVLEFENNGVKRDYKDEVDI